MSSFQAFVENLPGNFPPIREAHFYSEIDSTNKRGMELGREGSENGTLIVADHQSAGRGRLKRKWESAAEKGLYFSLLIRPPLQVSLAPLLTLAAGLALGRTLRKGIPDNLLIKWPNDILINRMKVAGILTEMVSQEKKILFAVLGVGVNVYQSREDFSEEIREKATSLTIVSPKKWDRGELLVRFLSEFFLLSDQLHHEGGPKKLIELWSKESGMIGQKVQAMFNGHKETGIALRLNPQGHLELQKENKTIITLIAEDTTLL